MSKPAVTVLMPVYNAEAYLFEAIESIINQTFHDFEFLIINDGSTDNSEKIIKTFADKRIRYLINSKNLKVVQTLNKGLSLSRGKYIARMDADDISLPCRLEKQVNFMENNPEVGLLGTWFEYYPSGITLKSPVNHEEIYAQLFKYNAIAHPSVMLRHKILTENTYVYKAEFEHAEDYELWSRLIEKTKVANIPEVLLKYRVHKDQITTSSNKLQLQSKIQVKANMYKRLVPENNDFFHSIMTILNNSERKISNDEFVVVLKTYNEAYLAVNKLHIIDSRLFLNIHTSFLKEYLIKTKSPSFRLILSLLSSRLFRDAKFKEKALVILKIIKSYQSKPR